MNKPKQQIYCRKSIDELTFADRWMFDMVMRDEAICKSFLEALLETKIRKIRYIDSEKGIEPLYEKHGIRLDVYLEDDNNTVYDIEMQNVDTGVIPKRARYYQSSMDMARMEKNLDYDKLPDSYIIFVCAFDLFGKDWPIYHVRHVLAETENDDCVDKKNAHRNAENIRTDRTKPHENTEQAAYEDGSHLIFLNAKSTVISEIENADIRDFLRAVSDIVPKERKPESILGKQIADRMTGVKSDQEVRKKYMNTELYIYEEKKQARLEGMQEGMERGMTKGARQANEETARRMKSKGFSVSDISGFTGLTEEEIRALQ